MKVTGSLGRNATGIRFIHRGMDFRFRHIFPHSPSSIEAYKTGDQLAEVVIDFEDLYEVRNLIQMLEEFHKLCKMAAGTWQPTYK